MVWMTLLCFWNMMINNKHIIPGEIVLCQFFELTCLFFKMVDDDTCRSLYVANQSMNVWNSSQIPKFKISGISEIPGAWVNISIQKAWQFCKMDNKKWISFFLAMLFTLYFWNILVRISIIFFRFFSKKFRSSCWVLMVLIFMRHFFRSRHVPYICTVLNIIIIIISYDFKFYWNSVFATPRNCWPWFYFEVSN